MLIFLIVLTPTFFYFNFEVNEVSADGPALRWNTASSKIFLTSSPATFYDSNFYIRATNVGEIPLNVTITAAIINLLDWQNNFSISWDKNHVPLAVNESVEFVPTIFVNVSLSFTYKLHTILRGEVDNPDGSNTIISSIGGQIHISVLSEEEGATLELRSTDQGDIERQSTMEIYYGGKNATGWSIIQTVQDSYYKNVVPKGWYKVFAWEKDTNQFKKGIFEVTNYTQFNIIFDLIQFSEWQPFMANDSLIINWTISNNYISLPAVTARFYLVKDGNILAVDEFKYDIFEKGSRKNVAILKTQWDNANYTFVGEIWTSNKVYLNRTDYILVTGIPPRIVEDVLKGLNDLVSSPAFPVLFTVIAVSSGIIIGINKDKIIHKLKRNKTSTQEIKQEINVDTSPQIDESVADT
jgi:hypothetical protein